jgi:methionyl-tRNA synthetase
MLHAIGFPDDQMPQLLVHGWWNLGGAKMSKSAGNIIDPFVLADKYGAETLRYYLMSDIVTGKDADFSEERLIESFNSELGNRVGNLLNRFIPMLVRFREGKLKKTTSEKEFNIFAYRFKFDDVVANYRKSFEDHWVSNAVNSTLVFAMLGNLIIDEEKPWSLIKKSEEAYRIDALFYTLAEALRITAVLLWPVLPRAAHRIFDQLNWKMELSGNEERFSLADAEWGRLPDGHVVGKPVPLFPRIEISG